MSAQIFEDKSLDAALEQAAAALGVSLEELEHELLDEKADDFWGLGDTIYTVRAWRRGETPDAEEPEEEASADESQPPPPAEHVAPAATETPAPLDAPETPATDAAAEDASDDHDEQRGAEPVEVTTDNAEEMPDFFQASDVAPEPTDAAPPAEAVSEPTSSVDATDDMPESGAAEPAESSAAADPSAAAGGETDVSDEAIELLDTIFDTMGFDCEAEARLDGETLQIAITGDDNQYLLDGRGRGLSALELILNHAFRHRPDRAHRRVRVDAGDFRSQRDDEIRDMAYQVAHQAKETSSPQQTGPLNPYERRIVHLTLADDPKVKTRSIGNGFQKAVNVIPTDRGSRR